MKRFGLKTMPYKASFNMKKKEGAKNNGWVDCFYCETPKIYFEMEVDHLVPVINGGINNKKNTVLCCPDCNRDKGNNILHFWLLSKGINPEYIYNKLRKKNKSIPVEMLKYLGYSE